MELSTGSGARTDWVDYARGLCIALIVLLHSGYAVLGAGGSVGYVHHIVDFARPFRLPTLFFISGLFLTRAIHFPWRRFFDARITRFIYFYALPLCFAIARAVRGVPTMPWPPTSHATS